MHHYFIKITSTCFLRGNKFRSDFSYFIIVLSASDISIYPESLICKPMTEVIGKCEKWKSLQILQRKRIFYGPVLQMFHPKDPIFALNFTVFPQPPHK